MPTIEERVHTVVRNNLGGGDYDDDTKLGDDLGADSLDMAQVQMDIAEEFDIVTPDNIPVSTIGKIVNFVKEKAQ